MNNLPCGIIVVIICVIGYVFSFLKQKNKEYVFALILLVICGTILRVYCAVDPFLHCWDERYHALVAKHLTNHFFLPVLYSNSSPLLPYDYTNWTLSHLWLHKQPLPLWLMAISLKVFGIHIWAVRFPSLLLSSISIKLMYDIAVFFYDKRVAFIAAFLYSINGLIIELAAGRTATDHIDSIFLFFVIASVWSAIISAKKKTYWATILFGVLLGSAILCKWLPALAVFPVWFLLFYAEDKQVRRLVLHSAILLGTCLIIVLPWQIYILLRFPIEAHYEYAYNVRHFTTILDGQGGNFLYYFNMLRINFGEFVYLPLLLFSYNAVKRRNYYDLIILCWFIVPYLFFSFCATKMQAYTILAAPPIFIITGKYYFIFKNKIEKSVKFKWLYFILAYGLLILPARFCLERVKPFNINHDNDALIAEIKLIRESPLNNAQVVIFNCDHPIEIMFETECTCFEQDITPQKADVLKQNGFIVFKKNENNFSKF